MNASTILDAKLKALGIPIHGVCYADRRIDFADEATQEQRAQANSLMAGFDEAAEKVSAETVAKAKKKISDLEAGQHRAIREAVLSGDKTRLQAIENQIVSERAKL